MSEHSPGADLTHLANNSHQPRTRSLRRSLGVAILLSVLYGVSLPSLVLSRLLPQARSLEHESDIAKRAFTALRQQSEIVRSGAAQVRALDRMQAAPSDSQLTSLGHMVRALRVAPRADYGDLAAPMRGAFAQALASTDNFAALLDEIVRGYQLNDADKKGRDRIERANLLADTIATALDETQRRGMDDLLLKQRRMSEVGRELVMWTILWLAIGLVLIAYVSRLAIIRVLRPLDALEAGLTQLSAGDLEARVPESGDEVGRLARVFNRASQVLRRRAEEQGRFAAAGQLLADVAHEVNNPLMAILGTADSRLEDARLERGTRDDLILVRDQAQRAGKLLSGLLRFVRAVDEPAEVVALAPIVGRAVDLVAYQFRLDGVVCRIDTGTEPVHVKASATRIEQVLVNLLTNAVHSMAGAAGERVIDVSLSAENGVAKISVRDSGPGVSPLIRARLFEPFASTKGDQGTGLGLYICRRIAREFGGELRHEDVTPGAVFTLTLPSAGQSVALAATAKVDDDANSIAGLRVLVVDDEDGVRRAIARYLLKAGADVSEACDGEDALTRLKSDVPDVMLLDLRMPVLDGRAVLERLRATTPNFLHRVIVLSGDLTAGNVDHLPIPSNRVLAKPIALLTLKSRLREVADAAHALSK